MTDPRTRPFRRVREYMHADPPTIGLGATFAEVARAMRDRKTNGLVVVDADRRPVGILASQLLIRHVLPMYLNRAAALSAFDNPYTFRKRVHAVARDPVTAFMSTPVHTIHAEAPMIEAAAILAAYRQLPVVDAAGKLVGLLTRTDLKNVIAEILDEGLPS